MAIELHRDVGAVEGAAGERAEGIALERGEVAKVLSGAVVGR